MGMSLASAANGSGPEVMLDLNTTPLIDVMLVLLVMLIITIPMQMHSVNLDMAQGQPPQPFVQPKVVELFIDFDGALSWNGTAVASTADLDQRLAEIAKAAFADQAEIHIKPSRMTDYGHVAAAMASVQRHGRDEDGCGRAGARAIRSLKTRHRTKRATARAVAFFVYREGGVFDTSLPSLSTVVTTI